MSSLLVNRRFRLLRMIAGMVLLLPTGSRAQSNPISPRKRMTTHRRRVHWILPCTITKLTISISARSSC